MGAGMRQFAAVTEEIATQCGSTAMIYVMHIAATQAIASGTSLAGRDDLLQEIGRADTSPPSRFPSAARGLTSGRRCRGWPRSTGTSPPPPRNRG